MPGTFEAECLSPVFVGKWPQSSCLAGRRQLPTGDETWHHQSLDQLPFGMLTPPDHNDKAARRNAQVPHDIAADQEKYQSHFGKPKWMCQTPPDQLGLVPDQSIRLLSPDQSQLSAGILPLPAQMLQTTNKF